ncbi:hypothetical protein D3C81_1759460 [compost metagenome]
MSFWVIFVFKRYSSVTAPWQQKELYGAVFTDATGRKGPKLLELVKRGGVLIAPPKGKVGSSNLPWDTIFSGLFSWS